MKTKAQQIIEDIKNDKHVSNFDLRINRFEIFDELRKFRYKKIYNKVVTLIDTANESL